VGMYAKDQKGTRCNSTPVKKFKKIFGSQYSYTTHLAWIIALFLGIPDMAFVERGGVRLVLVLELSLEGSIGRE